MFIKVYIKFKKSVLFILRAVKYHVMNLLICGLTLVSKQKIDIIEIDSCGDSFFDIEILGEVKTRSGEEALDFIEYIKESSLLVAYMNKDIVIENFVNLYKYKDCILTSPNGKIGISVFDNPEKVDLINVLKRRCHLKLGGAKLKVAYVKANSKVLATTLKQIGRNGYDVVVCTNGNVKSKKYFVNYALKETRVFYSIGKIDSTDLEEPLENSDLFVSLTLKYDYKHNKVAQEYFRPFYLNSNNTIEEISVSDDSNNTKYNIIYSLLQPLHCKENLLTIGEIVHVLKVNLPSKYAYMKNYTVNGICSRTGEIAPGSIFFFRQQFDDKNDLKKYNEFLRLRLYIRATLRKVRFIFSYRTLPGFTPWMKVENAMEAHIAAISFLRHNFVKDVKVIAVTGSIGKTSTKDMLYSVFKDVYLTEKSLRNSNVQVKIGLNIQSMKKGTEFFIQEIGGGRPGGASRHSRMVSPDVGVITNIGTAHLGNFDSQFELALNKIGVTDGMTEDGVLFLNGDDPLLFNSKITSLVKCKIVYYGINNKECDYYADNIDIGADKIDFTIVAKKCNEQINCRLNVPGIHNVANAVCAFAVAKHYGIEESDIIEGISDFQTSETRQNLITVGENRIFVDCYNASIDSIKSSLRTLLKIGKSTDKRIAVLGDITGMGKHQGQINKELANIICEFSDITEFICYGSQSEEIISLALEQKSSVRCISITNRKSLESAIEKRQNKNTIILFKGSSKMKLDEIIDSVYGLALADQRYIDENKYIRYYKNNIEYNLFAEYASVKSMGSTEGVVKIPSTVVGKPVKIVSASACEDNKKIRKVILGDNIKHIGKSAFKNCSHLESVKVGSKLKMIEEEAFAECPLKHIDMRNATPIIKKNNDMF